MKQILTTLRFLKFRKVEDILYRLLTNNKSENTKHSMCAIPITGEWVMVFFEEMLLN